MLRFHRESWREGKQKSKLTYLLITCFDVPSIYIFYWLMQVVFFRKINIFWKWSQLDIISRVISAYAMFLIKIYTWNVYIFLFLKGLASHLIQFCHMNMKRNQKIQVYIVYASESKLFELTKLLNLTNDSITGKIH